MVATSQAPATLSGLQILRQGGNAVDAAIAAAAVLCVAEPMSTGIGGDGFALVFDGSQVHALDAGGAAPASALSGAPEEFGPNSVVAPALVAGWAELSRRFGRLELDRCLLPAIELAERGVAAGYHCAYAWSRAARAPAEFGPVPRPGDVFHLPALAASLRQIAEQGPQVLYQGRLAEAIASASWLELADLAAVRPRWVRPLVLNYRGVEVFEMPPPTQGVAALEGLGLLETMGNPTPERLVHAVALALEDARSRVRDGASVDDLLEGAYLARRSRERPRPTKEPGGGTVYLCTLDADGMAVSLIQSLYASFGSGVVANGTGIVLNNRAACFSVGSGIEAGRRPYHTTIPGLLVEQGRLRGPFGVMGGFIQAQAHIQLVSGLIDHDLDPQAALDQARFRIDGATVHLEEGLWSRAEAFAEAGLKVRLDDDRLNFGGGQAIQVLEGRILGGSDARKDGFAAGL